MSTPNPCQDCPLVQAVRAVLPPPTTAAALTARVAALEARLTLQQDLMTVDEIQAMVGG